MAGGVSANSRLRADLKARGERREIPTFLPSLALSTDNAAMIAAAGLRKFRAGHIASLDLNADAALTLLKLPPSLTATHQVTNCCQMHRPHRLSLVQHQEAAGVHPHHR